MTGHSIGAKPVTGPRCLVVDVETVPLAAFAWGIWQQNIDPLTQIVAHPRMICWGAKWHGTRKKFFASEYHDGRGPMLEALHGLLDEADFVVGWNSARFDRPWIDGEFDKEGLGPAGPARDIDLMRVAKKQFRLPSYKLDYVAQHHYGLPGKVSHTGFRLWRDIMLGDEETQAKAWRLMKKYQLGDVDVTDAVFTRMKPWVRLLPNPALYGADGEPEACGCGNTQLQQRGHAYTNVSRYARYQCTGDDGCGAWLRGAKRDKGIDLRRIS